MPAVALTDRANLFGALEFSGCHGHGRAADRGLRLPLPQAAATAGGRAPDADPVVLLAQSGAASQPQRLSSRRLPRTTPPAEAAVPEARTVAEHAEGLILLSGGPDGPVDRLLAGRPQDRAARAAGADGRAFGDRF